MFAIRSSRSLLPLAAGAGLFASTFKSTHCEVTKVIIIIISINLQFLLSFAIIFIFISKFINFFAISIFFLLLNKL